MKHLLRIGCFVLLLYLGFVTYVAANQDRYLYNASHESEFAMLSEAAVRGLLPLRNVQGEITGWHLQNPSATRRLLVFHGGSGYALSREFYARAFEQLGWDVSLFEYPGFGARSGKPGRESFLAAGRDFLRDRAAEDRRPLYLLGESMGSGTVCGLARESGDLIAGIALVVPYARLAEVAKRRMPMFPVDLLLRDAYDNTAALESYSGPLAVVVADQDEVVGPEQGRKLYDEYRGPKRLITLRNSHHADFSTQATEKWWSEISDFLAQGQ